MSPHPRLREQTSIRRRSPSRLRHRRHRTPPRRMARPHRQPIGLCSTGKRQPQNRDIAGDRVHLRSRSTRGVGDEE